MKFDLPFKVLVDTDTLRTNATIAVLKVNLHKSFEASKKGLGWLGPKEMHIFTLEDLA